MRIDLPASARAYVATAGDEGQVERALVELPLAELGPGEVLIRIEWSGVNYKDGLAVRPRGGVARISPLVPGIDLAGTVVDVDASAREVCAAGDRVLVTGYGLGVSHHGGYAEYARVPAEWIVPVPGALTAREAMTLGTAGFTAALSVHHLLAHGVTPAHGPVVVTGATGGVGSVAVDILAGLGFDVAAVTGTVAAEEWLRDLGATTVIPRAETEQQGRPLESGRWAGAVDAVGGAPLAWVLRTLAHGGIVAASGNAAGIALSTTVLPFILRDATLRGVDSVLCPMPLRRDLWNRLASEWRPRSLAAIADREVDLAGLGDALDAVVDRQAPGRTLVRLAHH
jgi:acrylyl-CoA reductase (NADPH)